MKSKSMAMKLVFVFSISTISCTSHPVIPQAKDIVVSREPAKSQCQSLGAVEGRSISVSSSIEESLVDMKQEAIRKGANYVKMETMGAYGKAVRGEAFYCP